jgi:hypothetical protein
VWTYSSARAAVEDVSLGVDHPAGRLRRRRARTLLDRVQCASAIFINVRSMSMSSDSSKSGVEIRISLIDAGLSCARAGPSTHIRGKPGLTDGSAHTTRASAPPSSAPRLQQLEGHALAALGDVWWVDRDAEHASEWYGQSLRVCEAIGDVRGEAWMLQCLARCTTLRGDRNGARTLLERATALSMQCSDEELMDACARLRVESEGATTPT